VRKAQGSGVFVIARVARVNSTLKVFWVDEYGDPIPIFAHDYRVVGYEHSPQNTTGWALKSPPGNPHSTRKNEAKIELKMPKVGDYALMLLANGNRDIPRCIGFLKSKQFSVSPDE
jgi:hypothetical protein